VTRFGSERARSERRSSSGSSTRRPEILWSRVRDRDQERRAGYRAFTMADIEDAIKSIERPREAELAFFDPPSNE
jgi:hypothetical protein